MQANADWKWKQLTADSSGSGRQLLNLFEESQLTDEELLAREVIQNSKDSAATLRHKISIGDLKIGDAKPPKFRMEFALRDLSKSDANKIWDTLKLEKLKKFLQNSLQNKQNNSKIPKPDLLNKNGMSILTISDFGCTGLGGDLRKPKISNYFRGLISIGITGEKQALSGGTRGFGKSAFVAGSGVFTVFAYAKFPEENGYKVTRHFGGVVYTFDHSDGEDLTGVGTFGDTKDKEGQVILPLKDKDADELAALFGLPDRSGDEWDNFGTTIVIMCPTVDLQGVLEATERYWWPAIIDGELEVDFLDSKSKTAIYPKPKSRPDLSPYFAAYDLAKGDRDAILPYEYSPKWPVEDRSSLNKEVEKKGPKEYALGSVGYKIDPKTGFVEAEAITEESGSTSSWVALIRSTGMIINYEELKFRKDPVVHGVMLATNEAESILQAVEPPSHSRWFPQKQNLDTEVGRMLASIEERLRKDIRELKKKVQPPEDLKRKRIEILSKAFGELFKASSKGRPVKPANPKQEVQIQWLKKASLELGEAGGEFRRYRSKIKVKINIPSGISKSLEAELSVAKIYDISLSANVVLDESVAGESVLTNWVGNYPGFTKKPGGSLRGILVPGKWYEFESLTTDLGLVRVMLSATVKLVVQEDGTDNE